MRTSYSHDTARQSRLARLCNPVAIPRREGESWEGMTVVQPDKDYVTFRTSVWAFRAAFLLLFSRYRKLPMHTVHTLMTYWDDSRPDFLARVVRAYRQLTGQKITLDSIINSPAQDATRWRMLMQAVVAVCCGISYARYPTLSQYIYEGYQLAMTQF